jgi:RNA polymerase sigma-70 factor, ECF subfamily
MVDSRSPFADVVAAAYRQEAAKIVATLVRILGDWDLAEDAVQEALASALERWPRDGVPARPGAWLMTTARNKALDAVRRQRTIATTREALLQTTRLDDPSLGEPPETKTEIPDDRLALIFTCCHPALALETRVALTLRHLGGLSTAEIARAFLMQETAMAQRLVRAKKKIRAANIPFRVPPREILPERLAGVLTIVYLIFNEGYASSHGDELVRTDLCDEAIGLGRVLWELMPNEPEVAGLLALMLLLDSRRNARMNRDGGLVRLQDQDRSRWNEPRILEGTTLLQRTLTARRVGRYQIEAAIAAVHAGAARPEDTDWQEIAILYGELTRVFPSPVVALNRAVAVAEAHSAEAGLALTDEVAPALEEYHLFHSTRAELLSRLNRCVEARRAFDRAIALAGNERERAHLVRRRDELPASSP